MSTRKGLKAWVRYDGTNTAVAGSLIFQKDKPKVGKWKEYIDVNLCCSNSCECSGDFNWYIKNEYAPALNNGDITSPNHIDSEPNFDMNLIGTGGYELYMNIADKNNNITAYLSLLLGNSGTLTLSQGTNSVTYAFTDQAFQYFADNVFYDDTYGTSPAGSLIVVVPATRNFNTRDCISIYIQTETFTTTSTTTTVI